MRVFIWAAKAAAGAAILVGSLLAILLLLMFSEHKTPITLPEPTGHFAVGRIMVLWRNEAEVEELAPAQNSKRELLVWIWYPAAPSSNARPTDYLPSGWRDALRRRQGVFLTWFFKRDPAVVTTHSASDVPIASDRSAYPVILLRAGGSALTTDFTTLAEDLASHGYFVAGFDAPYRSFVVVLPDGRVVARTAAYNVENANGNLQDPLIGKVLAMWVSDTKFVVDQLQRLNQGSSGKFRGRMDLNQLGIFGHSFGGATALEFCHEDSRCQAAADLDGIPFGNIVQQGLAKPCMFLLSDHSRELADPSSKQVLAEIQSIYQRLPDVGFYAVIRTASHFSFSDQILLNSPIATALLRRGLRFGALDGRRGLAISADYVHTFFDKYLNHSPAASLRDLSKKYQEVEVEQQ